MREPYESPKMVTEKVDAIGSLVGSGGAGEPVAMLEPFFGLCPPCT